MRKKPQLISKAVQIQCFEKSYTFFMYFTKKTSARKQSNKTKEWLTRAVIKCTGSNLNMASALKRLNKDDISFPFRKIYMLCQ